MTILDRKVKKSINGTSNLFWIPSAAPTHGTVGDINTELLNMSYLGLAQDMIIDNNGVLRSRGAFRSITSDVFTNLVILGISQSSTGTVMIVSNSSTFDVFIYGTSSTALTGFAKLSAAGVEAIVSLQKLGAGGDLQDTIVSFAKNANDQGSVICMCTPDTNIALTSAAFLWGGNSTKTTDLTTGTISTTIGSKTVTGVGTAWDSTYGGLYMYLGGTSYVGQVRQINSPTSITLYKGANVTGAPGNSVLFKTTRPMVYNMYKGLATTTTTSSQVVGTGTKWATSGPLGSGSGFVVGTAMFRNSDGNYIGTISSVANDTSMALQASALIALNNEEYFLVKDYGALGTGGGTNLFWPGSVEYWADRYWYGFVNVPDFVSSGASGWIASPTNYYSGPNAIAFTKKKEPELLDLSPNTGDIIILPTGAQNDRIQGMQATRGGMLVFRLYDVFLITGYSPDTFRAVKIMDDGAATGSWRVYKEGVVWGGQRSMWYFDGTSVVDLLDQTIKSFYQRTRRIPANLNNPSGLGVSHDHVLFSWDNADTDKTWPYKNTTKTINNITMVINMKNGAISFFTNLFVSGSLPTSRLDNIIVARTSSNPAAGQSYLLDGGKVFHDSATAADNFDAITGAATFSSGAQIGPDCMFETIKIAAGNASRLKSWYMFLMDYASDISMTATIIPTNDTTLDFPNRASGTVSATAFPVNSNSTILKRTQFTARSTQLIVRVYQTATTTAVSQRFKVFWYGVSGRWMRWGRPQ